MTWSDIFKPREFPLVEDSLFEILISGNPSVDSEEPQPPFEPREEPLIDNSIFGTLDSSFSLAPFSSSASVYSVYESEVDDTPWYWYTNDYYQGIAQGITHIPYDLDWWTSFTDYTGEYANWHSWELDDY